MNATVRQFCCQGCGATLPVSEGIRFLTCNYCNSRLEVVQDEATTHTRLLDGIDQRTKKIERDVEVIRIQADLKQLDEAWARYDARVDPKDERGRPTSSPGGAIFLGVIGVGIGIVLLATEAWWLGLLVLPAAGWFMVKAFCWEMDRARVIEGVRLQYETRRKVLLQKANRGR